MVGGSSKLAITSHLSHFLHDLEALDDASENVYILVARHCRHSRCKTCSYLLPIDTAILQGENAGHATWLDIQGLDPEARRHTTTSEVWCNPLLADIHDFSHRPFGDTIAGQDQVERLEKCQPRFYRIPKSVNSFEGSTGSGWVWLWGRVPPPRQKLSG